MTEEELKELFDICEGYGIILKEEKDTDQNHSHITDNWEVALFSYPVVLSGCCPILSVKDKHKDLIAHLRLRFAKNELRIAINNVVQY